MLDAPETPMQLARLRADPICIPPTFRLSARPLLRWKVGIAFRAEMLLFFQGSDFSLYGA